MFYPMRPDRRILDMVRSVFVELLGWAEDAVPIPFSFVVLGVLLGLALAASGAALVFSGYRLLGVIVALVGAGLGVGVVVHHRCA